MTPSPRNPRVSHGRRPIRRPRGTTTVEYLIVLSLVFLGAATAAIALGPEAVGLHRATRGWASLPIPRASSKKKRRRRLFEQRPRGAVEPLFANARTASATTENLTQGKRQS